MWNSRFLRPWVGMKMANLHAASLGVMERILEKFPNISEGVLVEEVCSLLHHLDRDALLFVVCFRMSEY